MHTKENEEVKILLGNNSLSTGYVYCLVNETKDIYMINQYIKTILNKNHIFTHFGSNKRR